MKIKCLATLLISLSLMRCAHPQAGPSDGQSATPQNQSAAPAVQLNQAAVTLWLQQRGLETQNLIILSQSDNQGTASGLPMRVQFKTALPAGDQEKWRLQLRNEFSAWLVKNSHPEGQCTSVDLKSDKNQLSVDIQIVCR